MAKPTRNPDQKTTGRMTARVSETDLHNLLTMLGRASRQQADTPPRPAAVGKSAEGAAADARPENFSSDQFREWLNRERYVYAGEIGAGGMSRVFRAADLHLCRPVAMKILPEGSSSVDVCRFIHEAQVTSQLQHPNIVPIYDCGIDPLSNQPFFTMQMVERGRTFLDVIVGLRKRNSMVARKFGRLADRIAIILQTGDALAYAHSRGVVHQDVKPANVLVGDHGEVYVIDWGIAKVADEKPAADNTGRVRFPKKERLPGIHDIYANARRINDATFLGSPVHMAPEQFINGDKVDERSDIYGYGCMLYEAVTLHPPFDPTLPLDKLLALKKRGEFTPISKYKPGRDEFASVIRTCMEPQRSRRYQSVVHVQEAVREIMRTMHDQRVRIRALRDRILGGLQPCPLRARGGCDFYKGVTALLEAPDED